MFGRSSAIVFDSYGGRRSRWRLPRWLWLLLAGIGLGAGAVVAVQERLLPPRLSAEASAELRTDFERAEAERQRLKTELGRTGLQLQAALGEKKTLADEVGASRATVERLREDLAAVIAALPPDPRGGAVEVRAARFSARGGQLSYDLVLTRERAGGKPMPGVLQLLVAGESERGVPATVALKAVALSMGGQSVVRGSLPLPEGFRPRETTVQVLDRPAGKSLGMRVLPIK
jgi:hypothetical protein